MEEQTQKLSGFLNPPELLHALSLCLEFRKDVSGACLGAETSRDWLDRERAALKGLAALATMPLIIEETIDSKP